MNDTMLAAVVPEKAADFSSNFRHGIGGKLGAVLQVKAVNGF